MRRFTILLAALTLTLGLTLPTAAVANDCFYAGKGYSEGAVVNDKSCVCRSDKCRWEY